MGNTYRDLDVWQKGIALSVEIYKATAAFPKEEKYGLTSQMRRSAISIPSNIAEGKLRGFSAEFRRFLLIAYGSGGELETQIHIAKQLSETQNVDFGLAEQLLNDVMRMLNRLIGSLESERREPNA